MIKEMILILRWGARVSESFFSKNPNLKERIFFAGGGRERGSV